MFLCLHGLKALTPSEMVFGDGTLGRELRLYEIMRGGSRDGISALLRQDTRELVPFLTSALGEVR